MKDDKILNFVAKNEYELLRQEIQRLHELNLNKEVYNGRSYLHIASTTGFYEVVTALIENNSDVNKEDNSGRTPIFYAVQGFHYNIVELLLQNDAEVNYQDKFGKTPLSDSVFYSKGKNEIVELLLSFGADPDIENNFGVSPRELSQQIANHETKSFFK